MTYIGSRFHDLESVTYAIMQIFIFPAGIDETAFELCKR